MAISSKACAHFIQGLCSFHPRLVPISSIATAPSRPAHFSGIISLWRVGAFIYGLSPALFLSTASARPAAFSGITRLWRVGAFLDACLRPYRRTRPASSLTAPAAFIDRPKRIHQRPFAVRPRSKPRSLSRVWGVQSVSRAGRASSGRRAVRARGCRRRGFPCLVSCHGGAPAPTAFGFYARAPPHP